MSEERRGELAEGCAVDGPRIPPALPRELVRPVTRLSRRAPDRTQSEPCDQSVRQRPPPEPPPRGVALDPAGKTEAEASAGVDKANYDLEAATKGAGRRTRGQRAC